MLNIFVTLLLFWSQVPRITGRQSLCPASGCNFLYQQQYTNPIHGAAAINPNEAIPVTSSPLKLTVNPEARQMLCNEGMQIEMRPMPNNYDTVSEGIQCDTYRLHHTIYLSSSYNLSLSAAETCNGIGGPLGVYVFHYNVKYSSYEVAIKHKDGVLVLFQNVAVRGRIANPNYEIFKNLTRQIAEPGRCVEMPPQGTVNQWWYPILDNAFTYYGHATTFDDPLTNQRIPISIIHLSCGTSSKWISYDQFYESIFYVRDNRGCPMSNRLPINVTSAFVDLFEGFGLTLEFQNGTIA